MYDSLVFYNHFGNGDLFESREFVKEIANTIPAHEYYYCHQKNPRMFVDIPMFKYNPVDSRMQADKPYAIVENRLFINTWIGHAGGKYVLPDVGCVIDKNFQMFNDTLEKLRLPKLQKSYLDYLPSLDYSRLHTDGIENFVRSEQRRKILMCNGLVNSNQANNFDFTIPIRLIASQNKDCLFLVTEYKEDFRSHDNILSTRNITDLDFDLNEISYLATFCDIIIGRKSGPSVFAHNRDVWYSQNKKSLSFTYAKHSSHFVLEDTLPLRKFWSPASEQRDVIKELERILEQ